MNEPASEHTLNSGVPDDQRVLRVRFSVPFEYRIAFTRDCLTPHNPTLVEELCYRASDERQPVWFVADEGLAQARPTLMREVADYVQAHRHRLRLLAEPLVLPGGEMAKNDPTVLQQVITSLAKHRLDRHAYCVAIGGGAVLDVVGFAAATVHRGVRLIRLPTTVLAQNDAGVGVKNGINAFGQKNFLGCFAPPEAVINDSAFLDTLAPRDRRAGIAEAVKVALIKDRDFFEWLAQSATPLSQFEPNTTERMIRRGAELHLEHITQGGDPFERGSARPLDFGHWLAHKLEGLTQHELRHGEAVAVGIAVDTAYSQRMGWISEQDCERVLTLLEQLGLPCYHPALQWLDQTGVPVVERGLDEFREHLGGKLSVTYLRNIGVGLTVHDVNLGIVRSCIEMLGVRETSRSALEALP